MRSLAIARSTRRRTACGVTPSCSAITANVPHINRCVWNLAPAPPASFEPLAATMTRARLDLLRFQVDELDALALADGEAVQELTGRIDPGSGSFYAIAPLEEGQTLYVYVQGISGNLDPLLLLADDTLDRFTVGEDFRTDVERAIEEGRTVFNNLKKTIVFILPTNGGECLTLVAASRAAARRRCSSSGLSPA